MLLSLRCNDAGCLPSNMLYIPLKACFHFFWPNEFSLPMSSPAKKQLILKTWEMANDGKLNISHFYPKIGYFSILGAS